MSAPTRPHAAGWYRDPLDRQRMRHWSGYDWDGRERRVPPWMAATSPFVALPSTGGPGDPQLDGPARSTVLPANVTSGGRSRLAPSTKRPPALANPLGAGGSSRSWTSAGAGTPAAHRPRPWTRRAPLMVVGTLVLISLLVVATTVGLARRPASPGQLATDNAFITPANSACAASMGAVNTSAPRGTLSPTPQKVGKANESLHRLTGRLLGLPDATLFPHPLGGWLSGWDRYATDRAQLANLIAAHPHPAGATLQRARVLARAEHAAGYKADSFAFANNLGDCALGSDLPNQLTRVP